MKRLTQRWMILVLLLAAVCRLWMLPVLPLGLHYDEAANVILTRQIAEHGYRPLFIRAYTGKEVLFFYASVPWIKMTGGQVWGLRLSAAMLGILTVAATYAMARALLGRGRKTFVPLYAAAWMAVAFPHIILSRYGFRAITQPLLQALAVTALWRGLRTRRAGWLVAGGVLVGLTGYTYLAARLFPIPLATAMLVLWLQTPKQKRGSILRSFFLVAVSAILAFAPLGIYFLLNPESFSTRIAQVVAPSLSEAMQGMWSCLKALVVPGEGDPYVRFNQVGRPILDGLSALLACTGLIVLVRTRRPEVTSQAGRILVLSTIVVMLLPSALATGEITPSHLRLVGLYPFLMILPAVGLNWLVSHLPGKHLRAIGSILLFIYLGAISGKAYTQWSQSTELFYAADGEMVLAARAVEDEAREGTTLYVSSEHYRHPTLAALSTYYKQVKWNTTGASFILPPAGDIVAIVPRSAQPPVALPEVVTQYIDERWLIGPDGSPAVAVQRLKVEDIATLRQPGTLRPNAESTADFAHIAGVHTITPAAGCQVGGTCTISLLWEVLSPYPAMQPLVRILHPVTGQWSRTTPFHYPAEQWTPGDLILDQIQLDIPAGMPPGDGYQIAVSMVDSTTQNLLPRLELEQFAGLEYRVPTSMSKLWPEPPDTPLTQAEIDHACTGVPRGESIDHGALRLLGWLLPTKPLPHNNIQVKSGELLLVTLCWEVLEDVSIYQNVELVLGTGDNATVLYTGPPAGGYAFADWLPGTAIEDRYAVRVPREMTAGSRHLQIRIDADAAINLTQLEVLPVTRSFTLPEIERTINAVFDEDIYLRGYEPVVHASGKAVDITFFWQSIHPIDMDFTVFIHLVDPNSGEVLSQVDEQPQQGERPTSSWVKGEVVADVHTLTLPPGFQGGSIILRTGLYIPTTGKAMRVGGERELTLEVEIPEP